MKIKMNENDLDKMIRETCRRAGEWGNPYGGECQLYARHDDDGVVTQYVIYDEAGNNSWTEGKNLVHLYTCRWFDPLENEQYDDWLVDELRDDESLKKEFVDHLRSENEKYDYEHNIDRPEREYDEFSRIYHERWEEFLGKWAEVQLEYYLSNLDWRQTSLFDDESLEISDEVPSVLIGFKNK